LGIDDKSILKIYDELEVWLNKGAKELAMKHATDFIAKKIEDARTIYT
jgi:hypothetical protein